MSRDAVDVGLFVTCLVDLFRPSVGFASVRLLEAAGCRVHVPESQTCSSSQGQGGAAASPSPSPSPGPVSSTHPSRSFNLDVAHFR